MKKLLMILTFVSIIILGSGCENVKQISLSELIKVNENYKEPKVAICYYTGSDETNHYFLFRDLGIKQIYKVSKEEIPLMEFLVSNDKSKWIVMPWGTRKK